MKRKYYKPNNQRKLELVCFKMLVFAMFWATGLGIAFSNQIRIVMNTYIQKMQTQTFANNCGQGPFSDALSNDYNLLVSKTLYGNKN